MKQTAWKAALDAPEKQKGRLAWQAGLEVD
jgi:hypothetical protein